MFGKTPYFVITCISHCAYYFYSAAEFPNISSFAMLRHRSTFIQTHYDFRVKLRIISAFLVDALYQSTENLQFIAILSSFCVNKNPR